VALPLLKRIRRSFAFWAERDQILDDLQQGRHGVAETVRRLQEHARPGGRERAHVWSCREGYAPCRCPFKFDMAGYVPLVETRPEPMMADLDHDGDLDA